MPDPLVSIVVPVYNSANYLPECLNTIISNGYKEIEVICINDGSSDKSPEILEYFSKRDSRVKTYHQKNSGLSVARNNGLTLANGKYILFIDSDDTLEIGTIKKCVKLLEAQKAQVLLFNVKAFIEGTDINWICLGGEHFKRKYSITYSKNNFVIPNFTNCTEGMFQTQLLRNNNLNFPVGQLYEDWSFMVSLFLTNPKTILYDHCFYNYRRYTASNNLTNVVTNKCLDLFVAYKASRKKLMTDKNTIPYYTDWMFVNDRKILLDGASFLRSKLFNEISSEVATSFIAKLREISQEFPETYFFSLISTGSPTTQQDLRLIRSGKKIKNKYTFQLYTRKFLFLQSSKATYRILKKNLSDFFPLFYYYLRS